MGLIVFILVCAITAIASFSSLVFQILNRIRFLEKQVEELRRSLERVLARDAFHQIGLGGSPAVEIEQDPVETISEYRK